MSTANWMVKLGEGLLIGIGASIAFAIFQEMTFATKELEAANKRLTTQDANNEGFEALIKSNAKDIEQLQQFIASELSKTNGSIDLLATTLQTINKKNALINPNAPQIDWKALQSNKENQMELPKQPETNAWPLKDSRKTLSFEKLNQSIIEQKSIRAQ
tara:strand:+ start:299 stop:775 length:477 start_codon:yes stop_codon:yes gene_type:complete